MARCHSFAGMATSSMALPRRIVFCVDHDGVSELMGWIGAMREKSFAFAEVRVQTERG